MKQEECIAELTDAEHDDDEIDELAGDEGKACHPSTSPYTHARHIPHHLPTLEGIAMGPPPKILFDFRARRYACLDPGVCFGWSAHKLNS